MYYASSILAVQGRRSRSRAIHQLPSESLERYSHNSATPQELHSRVVSAVIYPSVLLVVGAAVGLFLLWFVVPRFATLLEPAMMIQIGVVVGGIIVLMYMPIFEIAPSIQ